ncbi:MAG TPA: DUF1707 and FHA domain-containing protein [Streptosporangiaceae bacterium]|nr:DUF1707 and FHA domain-containing protein [Streptosporangiaceae bacterium]
MWASSSDRLALGQHNELRASDAERDQAVGKLRDRFAEGRLSQETFLYRMDVALKAKFPSELSELFTDLPREEPGVPSTGMRGRLRRLRRAASDRLGPQRRQAGRRPPQVTPAHAAMPYPVPPPAEPLREPIALRESAILVRDPHPLFLPRQEDRRFSIGRAPSCDFTVADISVSRWHARLHKEDDNWLLSDLGSTNGTRLNGWRVTSAVPVRPGDQIMFGNVAFLVKDNPQPAAAPPDDAGAAD